jgi:hypothetical protein
MLPLKTQRACWYNDPNFTSLVRPVPLIPTLDVTVALDDGSTTLRVGMNPPLPAITAATVKPELVEAADAE